jgi:hypothetical protein
MTSVRVRGIPCNGYAENGFHSRKEMIEKIRSNAEHAKKSAESILDAKDDDFIVETFLGLHAQKNLEEVTE